MSLTSPPTLRQRLEILADAAKYDASCASSGTARKNSLGGPKGRGGIGSTEGMGICHAYAPTRSTLAAGGLRPSPARGLMGKAVSVNQVRGRAIPLDDRAELWVTVHPSYLLRLEGEARADEAARFAADLAMVRARLDAVEEAHSRSP